MDITLVHALEYDTETPVSLDDLIKSLEANDRLIRQSGQLLCELFPGLEVETSRVSVTHISQESPLKENFAAALVVAFQPKLATEMPALIEHLTGVHVPAEYQTVVSVFVMLIALSGIDKAWDALFPGKDKSAIVETRDSLLKRAAKLTGVAADRIANAVTVLFAGRMLRPNVLASQKVFAPTRGQRAPNIRDQGGEILVPHKAVTLAQSAAGIPFDGADDDLSLRITSEFLQRAKVVFHAHDRDKKKSGWAGHIPALFDERIPMVLEKTQSPEKLFNKTSVTADVLLTREEDENGDMKPKEMLLVHAYSK